MSLIARQSTARTMMVGPVLDATGVAVTDCVVADFEGSVNGGDPAALNGSATLTHRGVGFYSLALTATDLGTVGSFEVTINDTVNACPIKVITVIEEAVYDALFVASAPGYVANAPVNVAQFGGSNGTFASGRPEVNTTHWLGTAAATPTVAGVPEVDVTHLNGVAQSLLDLKDFADDGYDPSTNKVQGVVLVDTTTTATTATNLTNLPSIPANWITAAGITDGALTAAKFASGAFDAVWSVTARLLTAGTNIVLAKGVGVTGFNDLSAAQVNAEADTALSDIGATSTRMGYLDNLSAGAVALASSLATLAGKFTGITLVAEWLGLIAGKQTGNSTARTELRATGAGSGTYDETTDSLEANRDNIGTAGANLTSSDDAVLTAIAALNNLSQANIRTAVGLASANLDTQLDALPTNAELAAALATADDAVLAAIAALNNLSSAQAQTAAAAALTAYDGPTNAELATALAAADDAVLAAIAALNNLSAAQITAAVPTSVENADAILKRDFSAVTGEASRSALNALRFLRNKWTIAGGVLTVKEEDDTTDAWTGAVTQTAGNPVSEIDPA